ncbi:His-Xaa-Ser system radical SAM maturase HxsB [Paucibacter sp. DJ2R-2]|uniref:His-Xaa-Ser system radical SAM maturase HxsB n=1 Tax=Paucibacter sp. DJ2R-2 TaxID=2893558 RepID=UPI0021E3AE9F|nr:His-Xaa-Ser system radical SAM maturase HxsB [Paucibacter sp. DJ2R-2]MCV2438617.1 His-Xaa-Ser system radical SAM maturase HxsB [Paucibacter sp. DJ2R-2]
MKFGGYAPEIRSFEVHQINETLMACLSPVGEVVFLSPIEVEQLLRDPAGLPAATVRELKSRHVLKSAGNSPGLDRLYAARLSAKRSIAANGPELHILVPTLQCAHSCQYCQVSRAIDSEGFSLTQDQLLMACDTIMDSGASSLTVEFQGGDPLNRFDLVEFGIEALAHHHNRRGRPIRFVIASTLHQLTADMCRYFAQYDVKLSTSIDGPAWLHNKNRPIPSRDSYDRTVAGIKLAVEVLGRESISALMTTTKTSLDHPEDIVDEYVSLGLHEIFLRPLSHYGFARRNLGLLGYTTNAFMAFYRRALDRILWWNDRGVPIREVHASLVLNKLIGSFDAGYVDLQSPNAAGSAVLVYNYDGHVYPSDEARMLAEAGDTSFRMGLIGTPLTTLLASEAAQRIAREGSADADKACKACSFKHHCAPSPVDAASLSGTARPTASTEHCLRSKALFGEMLQRLVATRECGGSAGVLFHAWASPAGQGS